MFVKQGPLWHLNRPSMRSTTLLTYVDAMTTTPPTTALPLTLETVKDTFRRRPYIHQETHPPPAPPVVTTFYAFLRTRPDYERWTFGHVLPQSPTSTNNFLHAIQVGDFYLGSDGSVRGLSTTYASRVQSCSSMSTFITSHFRAEPTCTLCAKAYGYLGALYLLRAAIKYLQHFGHAVPINAINHCMDNTGVLNTLVYGPPTSIKYNTARHSDVIREILAVETSLPVAINRHHVKSHQADNDVPLEDLSAPVPINTMRDTSCTLAHSCTRCRPPNAAPLFPSTKAHFLIDTTPYSSKLNVDFIYRQKDDKLWTYLKTTKKWDNHTMESIHWEAIQSALYRTISEGHKAATKLSFKLWDTNEETSHWTRKQKHRIDHRCTRCQQLHETYDHIFHCPKSHPIVTRARQTLPAFLQRSKIAAVMIQCILHGLRTYLFPRQPPFDFSIYVQDDIRRVVRWAYMQQSDIGWSNLLQGRLASSWLCAHDEYHRQRRLHAKHSSTIFAPAFVQALWSFSLTIWHQRNQDIHGSTSAKRKALQLSKINHKITEAFDNPHLLPTSDHPILFSKPLATRLSTSIPFKKNTSTLPRHLQTIHHHHPPD